jgi:uncharacterized tellurite resistance protein B-like protein
VGGENLFSAEYILSLMIELSLADGKMTQEEYLFMSRYAAQNGIAPGLFESMIRKNGKVKLNFPKTEKERMEIFYYLLFIVKSDMQILPKEENLVYHYGFKLGINESLIRDFLNILKAYMGKQVPPDLLLDQIKKYLN